MGLLGTLIGGGLGFMFFGPLGAILGGALGSNIELDGGSRPHPGANRPGQGWGTRPGGRVDPLQAQQIFLVAMISLAAKVAKADGRVTPDEVASFDQFLRTNLGMPADERRIAARIFNQARDSAIPSSEFTAQIRQTIGRHSQRLHDLVTLLVGIALADGVMHPAEEDLIRTIARDLGLGDQAFQEALAMFRPEQNLASAYATLGLEPGATDAEVRKSYRRLAKEYHPDIMANKGLGEDFQKFAEEKMRAVNGAYAAIKEARGF